MKNEKLLSPSKSSSSSMSTSTMIITMVVIVISTTSATSWASVREQRRKRSVYENGKQLFTQSFLVKLTGGRRRREKSTVYMTSTGNLISLGKFKLVN